MKELVASINYVGYDDVSHIGNVPTFTVSDTDHFQVDGFDIYYIKEFVTDGITTLTVSHDDFAGRFPTVSVNISFTHNECSVPTPPSSSNLVLAGEAGNEVVSLFWTTPSNTEELFLKNYIVQFREDTVTKGWETFPRNRIDISEGGTLPTNSYTGFEAANYIGFKF